MTKNVIMVLGGTATGSQLSFVPQGILLRTTKHEEEGQVGIMMGMALKSTGNKNRDGRELNTIQGNNVILYYCTRI